MRKTMALLLTFILLFSITGMASAAETETVHKIVLDSKNTGDSYTHAAVLDGETVPEYDYVWHADPSTVHEDVKNSPAEYFTGTAPTGEDAVYIAHDIVYYPELEESKFQKVSYAGEMEWVYPYEAEGYTDYLFSTLPVQRDGFPSHMMHSEEEAYNNAVLHITQPGTYELTGAWHGQIWVDLGDEDDVYANPEKKVTLILNGVDITCTVAPGVVFASVYECDNAWEDADSYSQNVDTRDAGANVMLADGTVNNVSGTNIFRILKTKFKDEDSKEDHPAQKKAWKIDGAFYSYQSMNIDGQSQGTGVLNITSGLEGLGTEHHLTINGGNVNIYSQDDGINVNEDGVSVLTVNGGSLHICAGLGSEGDGIDSNGFLVVNGGTVITSANPAADSGLDSDCGSFVNGGTVVALGAAMDWAESDETSSSQQPVLNLRFGSAQSADEAIVITDTEGKVVFAYDPDKDEVTGENQRTYQGAIVSGPGLEIGGEYHIYIGGDVTGGEVSGVYDTETITSFSGASQQCWSGTAVGRHGGMDRPDFGNRENMAPPEGFGEGTPPEKPEGDNRQMPEGAEPGQRPEGMEPGQMPGNGQRPEDGRELPEGFEPGAMPPDGFGGRQETVAATCTYDQVFTLSQQVNAFSSVSDFKHDWKPNEAGAGSVCSACGKILTEDGEIQEPQIQPMVPPDEADGMKWMLLGAGLVLAAGCVIFVLFKKKNKQ